MVGRTASVLFITLVVSACGHNNNSGGDDVDSNTPDMPDGTGCTTLTPRTEPVESLVMPQGYLARMGQVIDGAQQSLDIQMYLWTDKSLAQKVVDAKNRGVSVRVIVDPDEAGNQAVEPTFTAGGIPWKTASTVYDYAHAKYLLVDHTSAVILSGNFNADAFTTERNYGFVDRDPEDVADVQSIFETDWKLANGATADPPNLDCTRMIVSPTNSKDRLLAHINTATTNLDVEVMYISETTIRNAIGAAKTRGATVRVILNDPNDTSISYLKSLGIPVKTPGSAFFLHAKLIIANNVAFVGSENMSYTSLAKNREVGGLVFEPTAVPAIQTQFETDWNNSTAVP